MRLSPCASLFFLTLPSSIRGFAVHPPSVSTSTSTSLHAIGVLARRAKEADVRAYVLAGPDPAVLAHLATISAYGDTPPPPDAPPGPLQSALTRRRGTVSIVAEYTRRAAAAFVGGEVPPPELLGETFREGGAHAVAVACDPRTGGCTYDDLAVVVGEQARAMGNVPGPLPVIAADVVVDAVQVARAAAGGADAVLVGAGTVAPAVLAEICGACRALGVEAVVGVGDAGEAARAVEECHARILLVSAEGVEGKAEVLEAVPNRENVCVLANILARENKALEEVEEVWMLRDRGFNGAWVSDALYKSGNDPVEHPAAIIRSMQAKSSVKYASARAKSGKGEGAKEYLGDIMM